MSVCPPYPVAGPAVAAELAAVRAAGHPLPATAEWLSRIAVLRDQLRECAA